MHLRTAILRKLRGIDSIIQFLATGNLDALQLRLSRTIDLYILELSVL